MLCRHYANQSALDAERAGEASGEIFEPIWRCLLGTVGRDEVLQMLTTCKPYALSDLPGQSDSRHWWERWVFTLEGKLVPIILDFKEDSQASAQWTIPKDENPNPR
jgi:hypothetical protein